MSTPLSYKLSDARALWSLCFDDDETFVDFYFSHVATEDTTLVHYDEAGTPIAHIGLPVYNLLMGDSLHEQVACTYISGACVHPSHRRGGLMRQLMTRVLQEAASTFSEKWNADMAAVILIPANEDLRRYYARHFGFVTIGTRHYSPELPREAYLPLTTYQEARQLWAHCHYSPHDLLVRSRTIGGYGLYHSARHWEELRLEYTLSPLSALETIEDENGLCLGLALARFSEGIIYVDHIAALAGSDAIKDLVRALYRRWGEGHPIRYRHANEPIGAPWGMIRPILLSPFLHRYASNHESERISFAYQDSLIPELTGSYILERGQVTFRPQVLDAPLLSLEEICHRFIPPIDISLVHE